MAKETILTIAQWCQDTFPSATLAGQADKLRDECMEFWATGGKDITELADVFIVACNMARFDAMAGAQALGLVSQMRQMSEISMDALQSAIDTKMQVNRARKWQAQDGKYQHVEQGE